MTPVNLPGHNKLAPLNLPHHNNQLNKPCSLSGICRSHLVEYFQRIDELPAQRLCQIVFKGLKSSESVELKYLNHMKNVFQSIRLDNY